MAKEILTKADFKEKVMDASPNTLVVIDFFADWCGPCKAIAPKIDIMIESKMYKSVTFYKINTDNPELEAICQICKIASLPTFCFFRGGRYVTEVVGANLGEIQKNIEEISKI